jgi:hypothetical protein
MSTRPSGGLDLLSVAATSVLAAAAASVLAAAAASVVAAAVMTTAAVVAAAVRTASSGKPNSGTMCSGTLFIEHMKSDQTHV